jgi:hypothetical protein
VYEFESIIKSHMSPFKEPTSKERDKELNKQNNKRQKKLNWKEKNPASVWGALRGKITKLEI